MTAFSGYLTECPAGTWRPSNRPSRNVRLPVVPLTSSEKSHACPCAFGTKTAGCRAEILQEYQIEQLQLPTKLPRIGSPGGELAPSCRVVRGIEDHSNGGAE